MRFLCYFAALKGFSPKGRPKMRKVFEFLYILNKNKTYFLFVFIKIIIISDLTFNIRSTVLKGGFFEMCK